MLVVGGAAVTCRGKMHSSLPPSLPLVSIQFREAPKVERNAGRERANERVSGGRRRQLGPPLRPSERASDAVKAPL